MGGSQINVIRRNWFLIALAGVLTIGFAYSQPLSALARFPWLHNSILVSVLFLTALPLETGTIWRVIRRPWAALVGSLVNLGLLPLLAWPLAPLLARDLGMGLSVAAAAPCTLASAAVWTRQAGGNDAVALLVTILTNLVCFVVTPLWLLVTVGTPVQVEELSLAAMVRKLWLLVVLPILVAQSLRQVRTIGAWATSVRKQMSVLAQCGILTMVLIASVHSSLTLARVNAQNPARGADLVLMALVIVVLHVTMLVLGYVLALSCRFPRADRIAVGIAGSQKTLPVGLSVAIPYARHFGGLIILPIVVYHVSQLIIDTLVARWWSAEATAAEAEPTPVLD